MFSRFGSIGLRIYRSGRAERRLGWGPGAGGRGAGKVKDYREHLCNVNCVAVPVLLHVVLHVVQQGTLRNANIVGVPVLLHGSRLGFKRSEKTIKTQCFSRFGSIGWLCPVV